MALPFCLLLGFLLAEPAVAGAAEDPLSQWFAIPAFFIVFRETLEATVLVAVLVQYLQRAGQKSLEKSVWYGAGAGGLASFLFGVVLLSIYYATASTMDPKAASLTEGIMLLFASVMITYFFVTHLAPGMKSNEQWKDKWEKKMEGMVNDALEGKDPRNFFILTFTTVFREGIEAVIFIIGIGAMYTPVALIVPSVAGILLGCAFGGALFGGSKRLDMSGFFIASAGFLILVAAGLAAHASYEFQKAGAFGTWACEPEPVSFTTTTTAADGTTSTTTTTAEAEESSFEDDAADYTSYRRMLSPRAESCDGVGGRVAWVNQELWDIRACCDTDNMGFFLLMVLFWYRPAMTNMEMLTYVAYWVITVGWGYGVIATIKGDNAAWHEESSAPEGADEEEAKQEETALKKLKNRPAPVVSATAGGPKLIATGLSHDEFRALKAKGPSFTGSSAV